eukprot:scaffold27303_cov157-Isochrysis_galbana.AAC.1
MVRGQLLTSAGSNPARVDAYLAEEGEGCGEGVYHLPVDLRRVTRHIFDSVLLARADEDLLDGRVVRKVDAGEEVVDGVEIEPQVGGGLEEGAVHAPVS